MRCNQNGALLMVDIKNIAPRIRKCRFVIEQRPTVGTLGRRVGAGLLYRAACRAKLGRCENIRKVNEFYVKRN